MQLIYENRDITSVVNVQSADIIDNAGGIADGIEVCFDDPKGIWSQWKPKKNDKIELIHDGFTSGLMYIDELEQQRGIFIIRALSIPQEAKTDNTKAWENVRFLELSSEIASKYGFKLDTYGIENHLYDRLDQFEQADFEFLSIRCMLEGYLLKITDNKIVIYDEKYMESADAVKTVYISDFDGNYKFLNKSTEIYNSCKLTYGEINFLFTPSISPAGPQLKSSNIRVSSYGEAERYSMSLLRSHNKYENVGNCCISLDTQLAAGNNVNVSGVGLSDGKYFCYKLIHKLTSKKTLLKLRKPLEGY